MSSPCTLVWIYSQMMSSGQAGDLTRHICCRCFTEANLLQAQPELADDEHLSALAAHVSQIFGNGSFSQKLLDTLKATLHRYGRRHFAMLMMPADV